MNTTTPPLCPELIPGTQAYADAEDFAIKLRDDMQLLNNAPGALFQFLRTDPRGPIAAAGLALNLRGTRSDAFLLALDFAHSSLTAQAKKPLAVELLLIDIAINLGAQKAAEAIKVTDAGSEKLLAILSSAARRINAIANKARIKRFIDEVRLLNTHIANFDVLSKAPHV